MRESLKKRRMHLRAALFDRFEVFSSERGNQMPYMIQGQPAAISTEPFLQGDKHFIPLREVIDALGGSISYDNATKVAIATIGQWAARVELGNTHVDVSGTGVTLTAAPFIEDGVFYVPFDFLHNAYGYNVSLNGGTLNIVNPNA